MVLITMPAALDSALPVNCLSSVRASSFASTLYKSALVLPTNIIEKEISTDNKVVTIYVLKIINRSTSAYLVYGINLLFKRLNENIKSSIKMLVMVKSFHDKLLVIDMSWLLCKYCTNYFVANKQCDETSTPYKV